MNFDKLRYGLALQAATARLIKFGYDDSSESDCKALLGFFAACYKEFKGMSDKEISLYFQEQAKKAFDTADVMQNLLPLCALSCNAQRG